QSGAVSYLVWWRPVGGSWTTNATVTGNSVNVTGLTSGIEYEFTVRSNCSGTSSAFASPYYRFTTLAANKAPVVSITSPSNGASYTAPATVTITANASDSDGSIAKVEFFNGSTKIGEDATSPYSIQLTNLGAATYTITAKATDNQGASATSAAVTFTVNQVTTCSVPSNLSVANVTTNSATLKWSAQPGAERYLVWWRLAGTSWTTYAYTTTNSYSLTGLQSGKVYEFTVMTYCSGTSSEFSANYSFTTEAASACTGVAQYKENGGYTAGSKVQNANGVYQCRPWPNSGWCNGAAWAYAPGTGTYWQDAWVLVASCGTTPAAPTVNLPEPVVNPNPASGAKEIEVSYYSETDGNEELSVIPFSGKVVSSETIKVNRGENKIKVNISDLVDGIYLIKIGKHSVRFVKD
ncbi:MAG TPA: Ig-like domain-containing protein, partial [Cytophagaceae bacterium]